MMQYKVLYVSSGDQNDLENQINTLVSQGWHLESLHFAFNTSYPVSPVWTVLFVK